MDGGVARFGHAIDGAESQRTGEFTSGLVCWGGGGEGASARFGFHHPLLTLQDNFKAKIQKRLDLLHAHHQQTQEKRDRLAQQHEDELTMRERVRLPFTDSFFTFKLMRKFSDDERIEQMNNQKRRMKQLEHRHAVDALVEARAQMRQAAEEEEKMLVARQADADSYKQKVIEHERQRLLHEHASKLGFFPRVPPSVTLFWFSCLGVLFL